MNDFRVGGTIPVFVRNCFGCAESTLPVSSDFSGKDSSVTAPVLVITVTVNATLALLPPWSLTINQRSSSRQGEPAINSQTQGINNHATSEMLVVSLASPVCQSHQAAHFDSVRSSGHSPCVVPFAKKSNDYYL